jgi:uncharacterized protein YycO
MQQGDLLLVRTNHFASRLIRFGQRSYGKPASEWNHVAVSVGNGQLVEALTAGVVLSPEDKYPPSATRVITVTPYGSLMPLAGNAMRHNSASFARNQVGLKYGWATICCIAMKVLVKGRWNFSVSGTEICSGLAAQSLERLGYDWTPNDPGELTPAFLALHV